MPTPLDTTFTATGQSSSFVSGIGDEEIALALDFTGTGSVNLEMKLGATWYVVETYTADVVKVVSIPGRKNREFRLNCTARSADIAYYLG